MGGAKVGPQQAEVNATGFTDFNKFTRVFVRSTRDTKVYQIQVRYIFRFWEFFGDFG